MTTDESLLDQVDSTNMQLGLSRSALPSGTVTFLFADVEGPAEEVWCSDEKGVSDLATQRDILRAIFDKFHGHEVDTQGDSLFVVFARAADALAASVQAQRALAEHTLPAVKGAGVCIGLHTGAPKLTAAGYAGLDVPVAVHLCAAAHGGQVLLSQSTHDLMEQLLLEGVRLRNLGEHRLKDLEQPRQIYQLVISELPDEFPPLRSLDARPHNLPIQLTSFIGREHEIAEIKRLLTTTRLLTLTGAGGCGKTRLALQLAAEVLESYDDGVWLIELASLADPALVPQAIAAILEVREQPDQPLLSTLADVLRAKAMLLVLDNCEQLIDVCARVSDALLRACPDLRILATSREALGIAGETAWTVLSLSLPDVRQPRPTFADLPQYETVQLFIDRAVAVQPSFKLTELNAAAVAQVCRRLDGIPLAIELAAARVKVLKTAEIAARLDDRFALLTTGSRTALPRHQTLRAAIDWSYDLLTESDRALLRRLSVFAGGCTLEAAETVCGIAVGATHESSLQPTDVLDLLSHLVDKSLVIVDKQGGETRYRMLETIREYARGRLEESGEAEVVRQVHAGFFVELAERVPPTMTSDERKARYRRFDVEQDNFRAALTWARATDNTEFGLRLVGALGEYWFWWATGWHEGWSWISQFLALAQATQPKRARANALKVAVNLLRYQGEYAEASRVADESLTLFRELGDKPGMAWVLVDKGMDAQDKGDSRESALLLDESVTLFRESGDQRGLSWALSWLAITKLSQGRFDEAAALFEESERLAPAVGDDAMLGMMNQSLAGFAYLTGDYARASELYGRALRLCREGGDLDGANYALANMAGLMLAQGEIDLAASQYETSVAWFRQTQQRHGLAGTLHHLGYVRHLQGDDRAAGKLLCEALALQKQQQKKLGLITSLELCAWISADAHQPLRAARLFGAVEAARERIGAPFPLGEKPQYDRHLEQARADLEGPAFDAAWGEGRATTLEQAIEYALEMPLTPERGVSPQRTRQAAKKEFGGLTKREREIAVRIAQGESNREIAGGLVVSERTVETHVGNILNKLGFSGRAQIRKWAVEKGLVKQVE